MQRLKMNDSGFTLIEFLVLVLAIVGLATIGVINIRNVRAQHRDRTAKTDINTVNYYLESFYEKNAYYPATVTTDTLKGVSSDNLLDKNSRLLNADASFYTYRPHECTEGKCKSFVLQAELEKEAPFIKQSLNQ